MRAFSNEDWLRMCGVYVVLIRKCVCVYLLLCLSLSLSLSVCRAIGAFVSRCSVCFVLMLCFALLG